MLLNSGKKDNQLDVITFKFQISILALTLLLYRLMTVAEIQKNKF